MYVRTHTYLRTYIPAYLPEYVCMYIHTYIHPYIHPYVPTMFTTTTHMQYSVIERVRKVQTDSFCLSLGMESSLMKQSFLPSQLASYEQMSRQAIAEMGCL